MIECVETGLVYRNPQPYLRAIHAWHPSIALLPSGRLACAFDLGQAPESLDYRTYITHSADNGRTWESPVRLFDDPSPRVTTHTVRIRGLSDGRLVGLGARFYRDDPNQGLTNRSNMGFVPMELILLTSDDGGRTWARPMRIETSLVGPAFEICHGVVELEDGRWLAPTQTWPDWEGRAPNGMKAIALVSHDQGRTWPESIDVMDGNQAGITHFEQSLVQLKDGRLLAIAWAYAAKTGETLPTPYVISDDRLHFGASHDTGLHGQTAKLLALEDGRILCVYRRHDKPGLWANLSVLDGNDWINESELLLWNGARTALGRENTSDMLSALSFGYPSLVQLPNREVLVVFWCEEDKVQVIRWLRLVIAPTESSRNDG